MARPELHATARAIVGKKVKKLRRLGMVPGNISGHNIPSVAVTLDARTFDAFHHRHGSNTIIDLLVDQDAPRSVLMHELDRNNRHGKIAHVQFYQINLQEKITTQVQIVTVGESPLVKLGGVIVLQTLNHITVSCLPDEIPQEAIVHLDRLTSADMQVHVRDLDLGGNSVEIKTDPDEVVLKLSTAQMRGVAADIASDTAAAAKDAEASRSAAAAAADATPILNQ